MKYTKDPRTVIGIYQEMLQRANECRANMNAPRDKKFGEDQYSKEAWELAQRELYYFVAQLENTEEVNPTKIQLHTVLIGGMPIGEIVERDGRKWKVVSNDKDIITTAELVV